MLEILLGHIHWLVEEGKKKSEDFGMLGCEQEIW
jgi:hypothetical protein